MMEASSLLGVSAGKTAMPISSSAGAGFWAPKGSWIEGGSCPRASGDVSSPAVRRHPVATSSITSKGQIALPEQIRERLHLVAGDRIEFVVEANGQVVVRPARSRLRQPCGMLRDRGRKPVSADQMNAAIAREHSRR